MGRPVHPLLKCIPERPPQRRKPEEARRTRRIAVPVSGDEYRQITLVAVARRCSLAAVLRSSVAAIPPPVADRPAMVEVRRLGNNVNQLLRQIHSGLPVEGDVRPLVLELADLLRRIESDISGQWRTA